ncbi:IclR family transcriptional regulator [Rhizorhabdus sp. FW153]|uniref:IclR family transcriptional regulator n=1 Tax=Rhizorhabdus sp. FW153 TaxID=3400216 RepID=UPI003CF24D4C
MTDKTGRQSELAKSAQSDRNGIQVIARAAAVMRALEDQSEGLSLAEISSLVGLARSTVQRIVGALADEHFLIAASPKGRVKIGPAIIRLASTASMDLERMVRPIMLELSRKLGETVDLSVLKGDEAVFVEQIPGSHRLVAVSSVGETFPLHCTANGKALLAQLPPARIAKYFAKPLEAHTSNTVTDSKVLKQILLAVQKDGFAWDNEEHTEGISAVGTWIEDPLGRLFALSVPVPTKRFEAKKDKILQSMLAAKDRIIDLVGG